MKELLSMLAKKLVKKNILLSCLFIPSLGFAANANINDYIAQMKSVKADFTQVVVSGKKKTTSTGTMEISRPNKFRWEYLSDHQLLVGDAKKIYIYDKDLEQVTIRNQGKAIDKSPAALLAGSDNISKIYNVQNIASKESDGVVWFKVEPKKVTDNNGFQMVLIGFSNEKKLSKMMFVDSFGNQTAISFSNVEIGAKLPNSDFKFKIPAGIDVLEQ